MVEVFIYLAGLNLVLNNLSEPIHMIAYCVGFGAGVYLGSCIEEYLALGYSVVQVIVDSMIVSLPDKLRTHGYGVTSWLADGKEGKRLVMQVLVKRRNEKRLMECIMDIAPRAFVISHEPRVRSEEASGRNSSSGKRCSDRVILFLTSQRIIHYNSIALSFQSL